MILVKLCHLAKLAGVLEEGAHRLVWRPLMLPLPRVLLRYQIIRQIIMLEHLHSLYDFGVIPLTPSSPMPLLPLLPLLAEFDCTFWLFVVLIARFAKDYFLFLYEFVAVELYVGAPVLQMLRRDETRSWPSNVR